MELAVVKTLQQAFRKALDEPEGRALRERLGMSNVFLASADYAV